jgi:hypothetical protein
MRKDKTLEDGNHERVRPIRDKAIDPILKATTKSELSAGDFVFAENKKEDADGDAKSRECFNG